MAQVGLIEISIYVDDDFYSTVFWPAVPHKGDEIVLHRKGDFDPERCQEYLQVVVGYVEFHSGRFDRMTSRFEDTGEFHVALMCSEVLDQ